MTKELSALLDGELEPHEVQRLWSDFKANEHLHTLWAEYHLIGTAIRDEGPVAVDVTSKVMHALAEEPVVLAPRPALHHGWRSSALALAAGVGAARSFAGTSEHGSPGEYAPGVGGGTSPRHE